MKTYQKMFEIELNSKKFAIFLTDNNRCAFLEVNKNGDYDYPSVEDFLVLNKVYNNRNPFILHEIPTYTFKEKVRDYVLGTLAVIIVLSVGKEAGKREARYEASKTETEIVLEEEPIVKIENTTRRIYTTDDLTSALGYDSVTIEEIHEAINNNPNLSDEYKTYSHVLADAISLNYPNADLRIFYENAKDKRVNTLSQEEIQAKYKEKSVAANYVATKNTMNIPEDALICTKIHEDAHTVTHIDQERNGSRVIKYCPIGESLDEAMNNKIVELVTDSLSYPKEGAVLDFYCSCVSFDIEDYINKGISDLIEKLESKYPETDINYLVNTLDKITDTEIDFGITIPLDYSVAFLDELFGMCKKNVTSNMENPYTPFTPFAKVLKYASTQELFYSYLDAYNEHLKTLGYTNLVTSKDVREKWSKLQTITGFIYDNKGVYPCIQTEFQDKNDNIISKPAIIKNGELIENFHGTGVYGTRSIDYMLYSLPENYGILETSEYWAKMAKDTKTINLTPVSLYMNRNFIQDASLKDLQIQIGVTNTNEIGFVLRDNNGSIIYISHNNLHSLSSMVSLSFYLPDIPNITKLELSTFLNESYLKSFVSERPIFRNISVINDKVVVEPLYTMHVINEEGKSIAFDVFTAGLIPTGNNTVRLEPTPIELNFDASLEDIIPLKEILSHFNYLDPNTIDYTISEDELVAMLNSYLNEISVNKAR